MPTPKQTGPAQPRRNAGDQEKPGHDPHGSEPDNDPPAAGPHAKKHLTNEEATPGAGTLSEEQHGDDSDPGAG